MADARAKDNGRYWDVAWNPTTGCSPVSAGCANCWARSLTHRFGKRWGLPPNDPFRPMFHPWRLEEPLHWRKPRIVATCWMGDLFHEDIPAESIFAVLDLMQRCDRHQYLVLTKRPERMREILHGSDPVDNIWLGLSAEDQPALNARLPDLLELGRSGWRTWVSLEPLLGALEFGRCNLVAIRWVVAGGETGPKARPMNPSWLRSVRDQCAAAGVPFWFKSWGEWGPEGKWRGETRCRDVPDGSGGHHRMFRVGPGDHHRKLDGRTHDEMPAALQKIWSGQNSRAGEQVSSERGTGRAGVSPARNENRNRNGRV